MHEEYYNQVNNYIAEKIQEAYIRGKNGSSLEDNLNILEKQLHDYMTATLDEIIKE